MFQSRGYQRGELFRRVHLLSVEGRNQDGNQEDSEDIQISCDGEARASSLLRDQSITQSNEKRCLCQRKSCCEKKKNKKSTPRYFLKEVNPGTPG